MNNESGHPPRNYWSGVNDWEIDMNELEKSAWDALELCERIIEGKRIWSLSDMREVSAPLRAALAKQVEPVAIPGAISMAEVAAKSRAIPERADALERARERLVQAEPVAWIPRDHLRQARFGPFLCRVEPTQRRPDFIAIYTAPPKQAEPVVEPDDASGNPSY